MDALSLFGLSAVTAMLVFYAINGSVVHELVRRSGNISVHVIAGDTLADEPVPKKTVRTAEGPASFVRSDLKGHGLGWLLMQTVIDYARSEGLQTIEAQVLRENTTMMKMCAELGFKVASDSHEIGTCFVTLSLRSAGAEH